MRIDDGALRFACATAACNLEKSYLPLVPDPPRKDATENRAESLAINRFWSSDLCPKAVISFLLCRSNQAIYGSLVWWAGPQESRLPALDPYLATLHHGGETHETPESRFTFFLFLISRPTNPVDLHCTHVESREVVAALSTLATR